MKRSRHKLYRLVYLFNLLTGNINYPNIKQTSIYCFLRLPALINVGRISDGRYVRCTRGGTSDPNIASSDEGQMSVAQLSLWDPMIGDTDPSVERFMSAHPGIILDRHEIHKRKFRPFS